MRATIKTVFVTLLALVVLDFAVAAALTWTKNSGRLSALNNYFDLGLSVPAKIEAWGDGSNPYGNLYRVAWIETIIAHSAEKYTSEPDERDVTLRSYGMSFSGNIVEKAIALQPSLVADLHGGPAAPVNLTFTLFTEDRGNRNKGDVIAFGILSSSVTKLAAMSNRTWVFEQPAPFTYPIYYPEGEGLRRVDPLIRSATQETDLVTSPGLQRAWYDQLAFHDRYYSDLLFKGRVFDQSPVIRLVRRAVSLRLLGRSEQEIRSAREYPTKDVLRLMMGELKRTALEDGQVPVVVLVQTNNPSDIDLRAFMRPVLDELEMPYIATADYFDPRDSSGFIGDGHYNAEIDRIFGQALLDEIAQFGSN